MQPARASGIFGFSFWRERSDDRKYVCGFRPVAGGGAGGLGGLELPPEIFRLELNSATKVEFFY